MINMKYSIDIFGDLYITNEINKVLFINSKTNSWCKWDYDHNGKDVYYENDIGIIEDYTII